MGSPLPPSLQNFGRKKNIIYKRNLVDRFLTIPSRFEFHQLLWKKFFLTKGIWADFLYIYFNICTIWQKETGRKTALKMLAQWSQSIFQIFSREISCFVFRPYITVQCLINFLIGFLYFNLLIKTHRIFFFQFQDRFKTMVRPFDKVKKCEFP
jgi:hypothetical protein